MREIVEKHLKYTLLSFTFLSAISYVYFFQLLGKSFDTLIVVLFTIIAFVFVALSVKWVLFFYFSFFHTQKFSFCEGLNTNIFFATQDDIDKKMVMIGALHPFTMRGFNNKMSYNNSIEMYDYFDVKKKKNSRSKLQRKWGFSNNMELFSIINQLIQEDEILDYDITDLIDFENMLKDNGIQVNLSIDKFYTNKAFSIQQAVSLLREALTCDLITMDDYVSMKVIVAKAFNKDCNLFDDFIVNYLIGAYCYYLGEDSTFFIQGFNKMRETIEGIKVLLDNDYFKLSTVPKGVLAY